MHLNVKKEHTNGYHKTSLFEVIQVRQKFRASHNVIEMIKKEDESNSIIEYTKNHKSFYFSNFMNLIDSYLEKQLGSG